MSGGSFNYLCYAADDVARLLDQEADLCEMAEALSGYPGGEAAAAETEELVAMLRSVRRQVEVRGRRLQDLWRAVEWERSCDTTREQTLAALKAYNDRDAGFQS